VAVGYNSYGQLNVSPWTNIKAIAAARTIRVGLKEDGTVVAVGYGDYDQLKVTNGRIKGHWRQRVPYGRAERGWDRSWLSDIIAGPAECHAMDEYKGHWQQARIIRSAERDGTVLAVGYSVHGQLDVTKWTNIKAIAAGGYHTVGLKETVPSRLSEWCPWSAGCHQMDEYKGHCSRRVSYGRA